MAELRLCERGGVVAECFVGQSNQLPPTESRVAYYRAMAAEALHLAQAASDEAQKASYLDIAARWNTLAHEVERMSVRRPENSPRRNNENEPQPNGERQR